MATVYLGDCLMVLRGMPGASVDAVVTDPPAGISFMGRNWDTFPTRKRLAGSTFKDGRARPGISQGQEHNPRARDGFVAFIAEVMSECLRVLKPGGHALVWAIPRTSHWTGMAIEDAGFEVRDFVCHHFGSGFPKSLDVSKAIDKAAGAEREALPDLEAARRNKGPRAMAPGGGERKALAAVTAPATDDAKQWDGWGTALKPATEIWWLARKPLAEANVAGQMLATGTGALNIDACRVPAVSKGDFPSTKKSGAVYAQDGYSKEWRGKGEDSTPSGRWPANLVLTHSPDCRQMGTRKVKGTNPPGPGTPQPGYHGGGERQAGIQRYAAQDGSETVEAWECAPGCPVTELDRQSGTLSSGSRQAGVRKGLGYHGAEGDEGPAIEASSGGASRFFYTSKASARERNEGLPEGERNEHPTVKPIALMRWLCRLVTPPGGLVLDPFAGSGSTGVAAVREGFRFIGIEKDEESCGVAVARIRYAVERIHQPTLFELEVP